MRGWHFTEGPCIRYTEQQVGRRLRSAPPLRPSWIRLSEGALSKSPCVPPHVWVRCRHVASFGFWLDSTCQRPQFVRDNQVVEIRVAVHDDEAESALDIAHSGVMARAQAAGHTFDSFDPRKHRGFLDADNQWIAGDLGDIRLAEMYDRTCTHCGGTGKVPPGELGVKKVS